MTQRRSHERLRISHFCIVVTLLLHGLLTGCEKESEAIVSIALHPTNANILYVATNDAVYKSRDAGVSWERFPGFSARRVTTIAIDPQLPATIYAGTMGDAVYKSPDGGQHWLPHNVGLKEHVSFVNQFVFHPALSEKIYAATTVGAYLTKDGGREWEERMAGMKEVHIVVSMAINPKDPTVYAGATKGLFRTQNRGEAWERIGQAIPDPFFSSIVIHPTDPSVLYIGGTAGVWKSTTSGQSWQSMNQGLKTLNVRALAMAPKNPQVLYAGTNGSGLYRSTNGGDTWTPLPLKAAASPPR
ncbi:MAG: hypothetical protein EWM72_02622 [Nitrospira sp.]|nr:MAG: hypothetical protein EWM72_02622 [Nitrospira sp.]